MQKLRALRDEQPDNVHAHRAYQNLVRDREALRSEYSQLAEEHPESPLYLYLHGRLLTGEGLGVTARRALELDESYPWTHALAMATELQSESADREAAFAHLQRFLEICPRHLSLSLAYSQSLGDAGYWAQRIPALRMKIEALPLREQATELRRLWSAEFSRASADEHEGVRERVRQDLAKLEAAKLSDPLSLAALAEGYELLGDQEGQSRVSSLRAESSPCDSQVAYARVQDWLKTQGMKITEVRKEANARKLWPVAEEWSTDCPDSHTYADVRFAAFTTLRSEFGRERWRQEIDLYVDNWKKNESSIGTANTPYRAVMELLLAERFEQEQLSELLEREREYQEKERSDRGALPERLKQRIEEHDRHMSFREAVLAERVALTTSEAPAIEEDVWQRSIEAIAAQAEKPSATRQQLHLELLELRADVAELQGRTADAVVLLIEAADRSQGAFSRAPELERRAERLWSTIGGRRETLESLRRSNSIETAAEVSRWKEIDRPLEPFELADLEGRIHTADGLRGKVVLINLWATWCGPCLLELPLIDRLARELEGRDDVAVLTLNADRNPGLIAPFLEKEGYVFETLLAYQHLQELFGGLSLPQNWIVDARGRKRFEQFGYGQTDDESWLAELRQRLEELAAEGP
ncbi:MAG: TlpA disulfide reductase family protein [Acidobacteriota bacterium]